MLADDLFDKISEDKPTIHIKFFASMIADFSWQNANFERPQIFYDLAINILRYSMPILSYNIR